MPLNMKLTLWGYEQPGLRVKELEVYGDSALIISHIQNRWKIKEERLMPYHECLQKWASKFSKIQ